MTLNNAFEVNKGSELDETER
uniref:Uncharacterized protein n=1 Tax=Anguilla anguilla TaxID=7936 RepID=A0A0E9VVW5_ANGAN